MTRDEYLAAVDRRGRTVADVDPDEVRHHARVVAALRRAGGSQERKHLTRNLHLPAAVLDDALAVLADAGLVVAERRTGAGRPATVYRLTEARQ